MKLPGVSYHNPTRFSPKQRILLALIPPVIALFFRLIRLTWRYEVLGREHYDTLIGAGKPAALAIWHESLALSVPYYIGSNFHGLVSYSFDGEIAARTLSWLGCEAVRGSSSRGGTEALVAMAEALAVVPCVGITMDGPRGPRREAKPGIAILSARTGRPILPHVFACTRYTRLKSWDRFVVPKPFARVYCAYAAPVPPPPSNSPEDIENTRKQIEELTRTLQEQVEHAAGMRPA